MNTGHATHPGSWRVVLGPVKERWRGFLGIWALTLGAAAAAMAQPWPLQVLLDHVLGTVPSPAWLDRLRAWLPGAGSPLGAAGWAAGATVAGFGVESALDVALTMRWVRVGQSAAYELGRRVFGRLIRRSPAFHAVTPLGDSLGRITGDSWCVYNAASALLFAPLHALAAGGLAAAVLVRLSPRLAAVTFLAAPLIAGSSVLLGRRARLAKSAEREAETRMESHVHQTLTGVAVVQSFAQELREQLQFGRLSGRALVAQRRSALVAAFASGAAGLIATVATGAVLWFGGREVIAGRLSVGRLLVFLSYLATVNAQLVALAAAWTGAQGLAAGARRISDVLEAQPEVAEASEPRALPWRRGAPGLALEGVTFGYAPDRPVLRGVDLLIRPGEAVAIVGPSGAGKSTLASLVARLADPWQGRIAVDGVDVRSLRLRELRATVSVVFQEPMLLAGPIGDNIRLGRPDASDEEVARAAREAGAEEFIRRLPEGYRARLGEHGATLSGGERQRIAISRALLVDPGILVLDEPTASLDARAEGALVQTLASLRGDRTMLIIAHRLSTVRFADRIAVLDQGRISEIGSHEQLLRRDGLYAQLCSIQQGRRPEPVHGGPP